MSNDLAKYINSRRRHKTDVAIARQVKIAKSHSTYNQVNIQQPHRLAKHHAMDCGTPGCTLCGNPRRNAWAKKERPTVQERRMMQDVEQKHNKGSLDVD